MEKKREFSQITPTPTQQMEYYLIDYPQAYTIPKYFFTFF